MRGKEWKNFTGRKQRSTGSDAPFPVAGATAKTALMLESCAVIAKNTHGSSAALNMADLKTTPVRST